MRLIGFNFHRIKAERNKDIAKDTKANTKVNVLGVSSVNNPLSKDSGILRVDFSYGVEFTPGVGVVELEGNLLLATTNDQIKEVVDSWKSKKLLGKVKTSIFNVILKKANVKALELEEELNLPLHLPMPSVKTKDEE